MSVWALLNLVLASSIQVRDKVFGVTVVLVAESYFALNVTFTTTASFACLAGSCVLLSAARTYTNPKIAQILIGSALIVLGSLIRFEMVLITISLALPAAALAFRTLRIRRLVTGFSIATVLVVAGFIFNWFFLRRSPEWHAYDIYNNTRSLIQDTHRLENLGRIIQRIGWSANDQELFIRWYYPEGDTYSLDKLQFLVKHVSAVSSNPGFTMLSVLQAAFSTSLLPYVLLICASCLWTYYHANLGKLGLLLLVLGSICMVENLYFAWAWKIVDRVLLSTFSATAVLAFILSFWITENARESTGRSSTIQRVRL